MFSNLRLALESQAEFQGSWGTSGQDRATLVRLIDASEQSQQKIAELQTSIRRIPPVAGRFKRARKGSASLIGERIAEIKQFSSKLRATKAVSRCKRDSPNYAINRTPANYTVRHELAGTSAPLVASVDLIRLGGRASE